MHHLWEILQELGTKALPWLAPRLFRWLRNTLTARLWRRFMTLWAPLTARLRLKWHIRTTLPQLTSTDLAQLQPCDAKCDRPAKFAIKFSQAATPLVLCPHHFKKHRNTLQAHAQWIDPQP